MKIQSLLEKFIIFCAGGRLFKTFSKEGKEGKGVQRNTKGRGQIDLPFRLLLRACGKSFHTVEEKKGRGWEDEGGGGVPWSGKELYLKGNIFAKGGSGIIKRKPRRGKKAWGNPFFILEKKEGGLLPRKRGEEREGVMDRKGKSKDTARKVFPVRWGISVPRDRERRGSSQEEEENKAHC